MTAEELEAIHQRSEGFKNARRYNQAESGPWVNDRGEMEKKTVLKRLCKSLPMSPELAEAVAIDNQEYEDEPLPGRVAARLPARRGVAGLRQQLELDEPTLPPQGTKT
jgi:recombinational DNA repair protein RecT